MSFQDWTLLLNALNFVPMWSYIYFIALNILVSLGWLHCPIGNSVELQSTWHKPISNNTGYFKSQGRRQNLRWWHNKLVDCKYSLLLTVQRGNWPFSSKCLLEFAKIFSETNHWPFLSILFCFLKIVFKLISQNDCFYYSTSMERHPYYLSYSVLLFYLLLI